MTLLATLISRELRADPADPHWPDRDRLLLATPDPAAPADWSQLTGAPPGLAFGAAVGQAVAERLLAARFGRSLVDHRVWLAANRAELICGTGREAAYVAGALGLGRLAVLATLPSDDRILRAGFAAAGWAVRVVEPGDAQAALSACQRVHKPSLIVQLGDGTSTQEAPVPASARGPAARRAWLKRLRRHASRQAFQQALAGHMPLGWQRACQPDAHPSDGTATAIAAALTRLAQLLPDLAALPLNEAPIVPPAAIAPFPAGALSWEGLDQAAPACLLGMALHGGILPISHTALAVALPRAALAEAAAQRLRWLHLTMQPAAAPPLPLLAIPNLTVFEPADAPEAIDCLVLALRRFDGPSVIALAPQASARAPTATPRLCARGAYLVHAPPRRDVTLLAAGSGVAIAAAVRDLLAREGLQAAMISMPCRTLWDAQDETYRRSVLGTAPLVAFAADPLAFAGLVGSRDLMVGQAAWPPHPEVGLAAILRHLRPHPASKPLD